MLDDALQSKNGVTPFFHTTRGRFGIFEATGMLEGRVSSLLAYSPIAT